MWEKVLGKPLRSIASGSFLCHLVGGSGKDQGNSSAEQNLRSPHFIDIKRQDRCQNFSPGARSCMFIGRSPDIAQIHVLISTAAVRTGLYPLSLRIMHNLPSCSLLCSYLLRLFSSDNQKGFYFILFRLYQGRAKIMIKIYCKKIFF